jgi:Zn-dependent M28 family amino/carboxypeptidase
MLIPVLVLCALALLALVWHFRQQRLARPGIPLVLSAEQAALAERLRGHVNALATGIGERNLWRYAELAAAAAYIESRLQASGLKVEGQEYVVEQRRVRNLLVELPGSDLAEEILVVGAHYDSVRNSPGANDNASGVAALLELAGQLANRRFRRTLRLVAFTNEEPPFFKGEQMGSRIYAERARARGDRIVGMICLETLGFYSQEPASQRFPFAPMALVYPEQGNFIAFVGNFSSQKFLRRSLAAFCHHSQFPAEQLVAPAQLPGVDWSDHWSFWRVGYPAIMLTDTAPYRYLFYHSAADTPDKLTYPEFALVVEGVAGMVGFLLDLESGGAGRELH